MTGAQGGKAPLLSSSYCAGVIADTGISFITKCASTGTNPHTPQLLRKRNRATAPPILKKTEFVRKSVWEITHSETECLLKMVGAMWGKCLRCVAGGFLRGSENPFRHPASPEVSDSSPGSGSRAPPFLSVFLFIVTWAVNFVYSYYPSASPNIRKKIGPKFDLKSPFWSYAENNFKRLLFG